MGGKNHQPTNVIRLIAPSAWLSKKQSEGLIAVLEANNHLEDAIISAMGRLHVEEFVPKSGDTPTDHLTLTLEKLRASLTKLDDIARAYDNLLDAAAKENYTGNPLASKLKDLDLSGQFAGVLIQPHVNRPAWEGVEARIQEDNILAALRWEKDQFELLRQPTHDLIECIAASASILTATGASRFVKAIEMNEVPLRQRYAKVFSLWNNLDAMFLYSALMMTELFYRSNGFPSLLNGDEPAIAIAASTAA